MVPPRRRMLISSLVGIVVACRLNESAAFHGATVGTSGLRNKRWLLRGRESHRTPWNAKPNVDKAKPWATASSHTPRFPSGSLLRRAGSTRLHMIASPTAVAPNVIAALPSASSQMVSFLSDLNLSIDSNAAEALAGPFFGLSLFPYLAFLYFLNVEENETPKGVVVGFATCLLFVFLSIPAAIAAKLLYGESLANSDWLHSSAESLLTLTNLVLVVAFRQALEAKEAGDAPPPSSISYGPSVSWVAAGTVLATATVLAPALNHPQVHTPYLGGFLDLPFLGVSEPDNALTVATWIIHISSLVEFLVAMGFCWRWADVTQNPTWKGLTWGLLPLHSSGITACTYHLFYNRIPLLVPLQALLTCVGNTTAAYAAYRIARSNGWSPPSLLSSLPGLPGSPDGATSNPSSKKLAPKIETPSLVGFEDLGDALRGDNDASFLVKLFVGCAIASYLIKYGETFFSFPLDANVLLALAFVFVPSGLNAFKWYKRSQDPTFEGWF